MKRAAAPLLVLFCSVACAQDTLSTAIKNMTNTGVFAFGAVGFVGKISQGEIDFRVIQAQPAAVALASFEKIYAMGDPAAKSYALAGIRQLDETRFKELLQSLDGSQETVFTMQDCIMEKHRLTDIAKAIDAGSYDSWLEPRR